MNGGIQMKDTDWVFGLCKGKERLKDKNGIKAHPTQKPLKLIQQILLTASNKGDLVFDPFMGSGTSNQNNFQFLLIEKGSRAKVEKEKNVLLCAAVRRAEPRDGAI